jgi:4,5-DOPA dioxygenase extradiol
MSSLRELKNFSERFKERSQKMPALFVGHGSPMNAIEENEFTHSWEELGKTLPNPEAILCISAHWLTRGSFVTMAEQPKTIHDFYGFPDELYRQQYPAPGDPELANISREIISHTKVQADWEWGLDHGSWSVAKHVYPEANIPIIEFSIDYYQSPAWHYALGKELAELRERGVLIIGSGNMVHNLQRVQFNNPSGFDWAQSANEKFKQSILHHDNASLLQYPSMGKDIQLSVPTPDHYYPLLYLMGMQGANDSISFFNDKTVYGSISMTGVQLGE